MVGEVSFILAVVITHLRRLVDLFASEIARNQELVTLTSVEVSQTIRMFLLFSSLFSKNEKGHNDNNKLIQYYHSIHGVTD